VLLLRALFAALGMLLVAAPLRAEPPPSLPPPELAMVPQVVLGDEPHDDVAISPDGRLVASVHRQLVHLWDVETGALLRLMNPPGVGLYGAALLFSEDGSALAAVRHDLTVTTFELQTGAARRATTGRPPGF
jgi:hypothetical protein